MITRAYKIISGFLVLVLCVNLSFFSFTQTAQAFSPDLTQENLDIGINDPNGNPTISTGGAGTTLTNLFGKMSTCSVGGNQSELFNDILGPLATASRAASILGKLTDSNALKSLGYQLDGAGNIINAAGNAIGSIQDLANGDLSGILNAAGGISELGSLLEKTGLVNVGGLVDKFGGELTSVLQSGLSQIGGYIDSAIGSVFGDTASKLAGKAFGETAAGAKLLGEAAAGEAGGSAAAAALTVPVNDVVTQLAIGANAALVSGTVSSSVSSAQNAITSLQKSDLDIQSSLQFKEYVLDCTTWNASHRITQQVTADVLDWITKGNKGINWITNPDDPNADNPYYITDLIGFYKDLKNSVSTNYLNELRDDLPNSAYKNTLISLLEKDQQETTVADRLTPTINPLFYTDFMGGGGFRTYLEIVNNPCANDPASTYLCAKQARDARIAAIANSYKTQLDYGNGFFPDTDETGKIVTPSPVVKEQANEAISQGKKSLENATNFWQLVGSMGNLVTDIFRGASQIGSDGTISQTPKGLTNVNTSRLVPPVVVGTANPFAPSAAASSTKARVALKLDAALAAITDARAISPIYVTTLSNMHGKVTTLRDKNATGTLPAFTEITSLQTDIATLTVQLQSSSTATWYARLIDDLETLDSNLVDILGIL